MKIDDQNSNKNKNILKTMTSLISSINKSKSKNATTSKSTMIFENTNKNDYRSQLIKKMTKEVGMDSEFEEEIIKYSTNEDLLDENNTSIVDDEKTLLEEETNEFESEKYKNEYNKTETLYFLNDDLVEKTIQIEEDYSIKSPIIEIQNYTKKFKKFIAVQNVSFTVYSNSIHGFIGPNGSGKTTIIKSIIGAYTKGEGKLLVNSFPAGSLQANKSIGYIPERAAFPSHLNTMQYLLQMASISNISTKEAKKMIEGYLKELGLWEQRDRKPDKFSSGMQKKVMLIQALLTNPKVLILDEPAANLDPVARKELFDILISLKSKGKTIFISSHILTELEKIVDSVTFIHYGKVLYSGSVKKLFEANETNLHISTSNNKKAIHILQVNNFKIKNNQDKEFIVESVTIKEQKQIIELLNKTRIAIEYLKTTDLLSIYNEYVQKEKDKKDAYL